MSYIGNQPTSVAFLTDQFSGTGSQTAYTLSAAPANTASILVAVSGVLQDPTTYSTAGTTLTFSAAPPSGTANISVRYLGIPASNIVNTAYSTRTEFTATAGQTTFSVPSYTVGFIQVYRNGVLLGTADYTATTGTTVVLATGATSGDLVTTISFYVSSVLGAIPASAGAVTTPYILDAAVTQAKLAAGVAGNGPAFSAYMSATQNLTSGVPTKMQLNTEVFDTANAFDSTTNYRFTPQVAGYYQINAGVHYSNNSTYDSAGLTQIYKNGSLYQRAILNFAGQGALFNNALLNTSAVIYMNGSTDYLELYGTILGAGTPQAVGGATSDTYFNGALIRAA